MKPEVKQQVKVTPKKKLTANIKSERRISLRSDGGGATVGRANF